MTRDWRNSAACRNQAPDFDYSVDGETLAERQQRLDAAVRTCHRCPVRAACEADIDRTMDDGVRAGIVLDKIRNVRASGGQGDIAGKRRQPREHGTEKGYQQHYRRQDLPVCRPCMNAHVDGKRARRNAA